jgi:hypothetical protein
VRRLDSRRDGTGCVWDGNDDAGRPTPPGLYFVSGDPSRTRSRRKLVRLE